MGNSCAWRLPPICNPGMMTGLCRHLGPILLTTPTTTTYNVTKAPTNPTSQFLNITSPTYNVKILPTNPTFFFCTYIFSMELIMSKMWMNCYGMICTSLKVNRKKEGEEKTWKDNWVTFYNQPMKCNDTHFITVNILLTKKHHSTVQKQR